MAPPSPRAAAGSRASLEMQRPPPCSLDAGASPDTTFNPQRGPDRLLSRLEAVDRDAARRKFALYGRQHAHVDHISGTQEDSAIILQSTMRLQEDGLLATRMDDVMYLLDGLLEPLRTQRGRLAQACSALELAKLLQDPQILQAVELSSQRRKIQDRMKLLLLRLSEEQDGDNTYRVALAVLVYVLSSKPETQEYVDDKVLDAVVLALKQEVARESNEGEKMQVGVEEKGEEEAAVPLKKTCLKRKQNSGKRLMKSQGKETEVGAFTLDEKPAVRRAGSAPRVTTTVSDTTCQTLLSELLREHELFYVDGQLLVSTADMLCGALRNLLQVDCSSSSSSTELDVTQQCQQRPSGDSARNTFNQIRTRKRQLVRNGGVDVLMYGLANRLRSLERLLPSSLAGAISGQCSHSLHRVSMMLCVFEQVTFLIVDVQRYISKRRTLFVLLLKLIRLLSELSWGDEARGRWQLESARMSLAVEVLLSALRVMINLTHHNAEAAKHVHALGGMQLLASSFSQLWCLVRSTAVASQLKRGHMQDKWEFDACLLLLSVMVNSVEFSAENHAALSEASLRMVSANGDTTGSTPEIRLTACDLFTEFFLTKVESYVDLINLTENGGANEASLIKEKEDDDWNPEDVVLGGCASLLLGFLMRGSSVNSTVILKSLPGNSPRLLLRALSVFVAFHSQIGALTPEVARSVLHVEKVLKSYQTSRFEMIEIDLLENAEQSTTARDVKFAATNEETDIDELSAVSMEDAVEIKRSGGSSLLLRARQLKNVCSNIDDSDEDDVLPSASSQKRGVVSIVKSGSGVRSDQNFGMRTPTRTPPRSPARKRPRVKSPMTTPPRSSPLRNSRASDTALRPDGSLSSPVVARLLRRTRQLVSEVDAELARPSLLTPKKRGGDSSEEIVTTNSSPCMVLTMDVTCRDNGFDSLDVSQDAGEMNYSIVDPSNICAERNGLSSKRKKKPARNPDTNSKSVMMCQETSFAFTPADTPPSTPLRKKKNKVLLQTPTRRGPSPGLYRQSPSLNLTPTKTSPSTPMRIKKSAGLLRIPSNNSPIVDQSPTSANPHRRKVKATRAPSAAGCSVFDFTD